VVKTTRPIDRNVALLAVEAGRTLHAAACADAAELEEAVKDWAVIADIVLGLLSHKGVHVVRRDLLEELDVLVGVKLRHLGRHSRLRALSGERGGETGQQLRWQNILRRRNRARTDLRRSP
jgi:hypothetical protein